MIKIDVDKCNDPTALGQYIFDYDILHIGRSLKNDLIFTDKELPLHYLQLKIVDDRGIPGMVVKSLQTEPFFFINGKKVSGSLKLRLGDVVSFGGNQFIVSGFVKSDKETDLGEAYERFDKTTPELKFALEFIEEILIEEEKAQNV